MYENIGKKIQTLAKGLALVGAVVCALIGLLLLSAELGAGIIVILVGIPACVLSSWGLYGFGVIVESQENSAKDIEIISRNLRNIARCMENEIKEKSAISAEQEENRKEE